MSTRQGKFNTAARARFLAQYAKHGRLTHAAMAAGVTRQTIHNHRKRDPEFALQVEEAFAEFADHFLEHVDRLCLEGVEHRALTKDGESVVVRKEYPFGLIQMRLRSLFPEMREHQSVTIAGALDLDRLSDGELDGKIRTLMEAAGARSDLPDPGKLTSTDHAHEISEQMS